MIDSNLVGKVSIPELVKALRLCQFGECGCEKCCYNTLKGDWCTEENHPEFFDCDDKMRLDAAAAIEALQAEVIALKHDVYISVRMNNELLNMEPKRGKWIELQNGNEVVPSVCKCSICGSTWLGVGGYNYCPNCGAKMEVQDG